MRGVGVGYGWYLVVFLDHRGHKPYLSIKLRYGRMVRIWFHIKVDPIGMTVQVAKHASKSHTPFLPLLFCSLRNRLGPLVQISRNGGY